MWLALCYFFITISVFILAGFKRIYWLCGLSYLGFLTLVFVIMPLPSSIQIVKKSSAQVVFRFDEYRYLLLTGSHCSGGLYYIDKEKKIQHQLAVHSAEVLTEPFTHTVGDYIILPYSDYGALRYSQDQGRTFNIAEPDGIEIGYRVIRDDVKKVRVIDNQLFIETNMAGIFRTPKPFGGTLGLTTFINEAGIKRSYSRFWTKRWGAPYNTPDLPKDYSGWYHWKCDYDYKGGEVPVKNGYAFFHELQSKLRIMMGLKDIKEGNL